MVTYSDIGHLPVPEKLFTYADAYLSAATIFCRQLTTDDSMCSWPNGAANLMLAAHSVELFLKAAILRRNPEANVWERGHDLDKLASDFHAEYTEPEFAWDIPFGCVIPDGDVYPKWFDDSEVKELISKKPKPSILYRYPVGKGGEEWQGAHGFEPHSFLSQLEILKTDFTRIRLLMTSFA